MESWNTKMYHLNSGTRSLPLDGVNGPPLSPSLAVHDACQIIGQDRECYFGRVLVRKCVAHAALMVPNGCSTVSRRCEWVGIKA